MLNFEPMPRQLSPDWIVYYRLQEPMVPGCVGLGTGTALEAGADTVWLRRERRWRKDLALATVVESKRQFKATSNHSPD